MLCLLGTGLSVWTVTVTIDQAPSIRETPDRAAGTRVGRRTAIGTASSASGLVGVAKSCHAANAAACRASSHGPPCSDIEHITALPGQGQRTERPMCSLRGFFI